jgi:hypothetical protein
MCLYVNSFNIIKNICESRKECEIQSNTATFGANICPSTDPFPPFPSDYNKQLFIQYQCIDEFASKLIKSCKRDDNLFGYEVCPALDKDQIGHYNDQIWCDGSNLTIACPIGQRIEILCSFYGSHPLLDQCGKQDKAICYFKNPKYLLSQCQDKVSCNFTGHPSFSQYFKDPCVSLTKMVQIQWRCT